MVGHPPEWHARRKGQWGSSAMAAVLGAHPFHTAADAVAYQCFELTNTEVDNDAIRIGRWLEPPLIAQLAEDEDDRINADDDYCFKISEDDPLFAATPDGVFAKKTDRLAEAKSTGFAGPIFGRWGDAGTDHVPDWVTIQCQMQMFVWKREVVLVAAALGKRPPFPRRYVVRREERIIEMCLRVGHEIWEKYVEKEELPTDIPANYEVLKGIKRTPNLVISIPSDLVVRREALNAAKKKITEEFEIADRAMKGKMGKAEIAIYEDESGKDRAITWFEHDVKGFTVKPRKQRNINVGTEAQPEWKERLLNAPVGGERETDSAESGGDESEETGNVEGEDGGGAEGGGAPEGGDGQGPEDEGGPGGGVDPAGPPETPVAPSQDR